MTNLTGRSHYMHLILSNQLQVEHLPIHLHHLQFLNIEIAATSQSNLNAGNNWTVRDDGNGKLAPIVMIDGKHPGDVN